MANTFNNEGIIYLFGSRIFSLCSIMAGKINHQIVSFIEVGQYKLLPRQSIHFLAEGLYTSASILFHTLQHQDLFSIIESMQDDRYHLTRFNICNEGVIYDFLFIIIFGLDLIIM